MSRLVDGSITCFSRYQPVRWSSLACPRLPTPMCTFPPTFLYVLFVYDSSANECLRNFCGDTLPAHWLREFGTVATGASEFAELQTDSAERWADVSVKDRRVLYSGRWRPVGKIPPVAGRSPSPSPHVDARRCGGRTRTRRKLAVARHRDRHSS